MAMDVKCRLPNYTTGEEIGNAISHGIATLISSAGMVLLIINALGNALNIVAVSIYGATMILLFCMSTLYHAITNVRAKRVLRVLDHTSIFFLIAGTYTPFTLITLRGPLGWTIFGVVWATAALGVILNVIGLDRFKKVSMLCYLSSGWGIVFAAKPLYNSLEWQGLVLLLAGGLFYTAGLLFYALKKSYTHMVWHFFVLAGAVSHYFTIVLYVL